MVNNESIFNKVLSKMQQQLIIIVCIYIVWIIKTMMVKINIWIIVYYSDNPNRTEFNQNAYLCNGTEFV